MDANQKSFVAVCQSDGQLTGLQACERIRCHDAVPDQEHADVVEVQAVATCHPGYELAEKTEDNHRVYRITCQADGTLHILDDQRCKPIDCGEAPTVAHATVHGSTLFGAPMNATANTGFSLDGTAHGPTAFDIRCEASGEFSPQPLPEFQRVACEVPSFRFVESTALIAADTAALLIAQVGANFAQRGRSVETRFGDRVRYTCKEGYRALADQVYAHPDDPTTFEIQCQANGHMMSSHGCETMDMCVPIACHVDATPGTDFIVHTGKQCKGTKGENADGSILRDFQGDADECMQKCRTLRNCAGFVLVPSGTTRLACRSTLYAAKATLPGCSIFKGSL